MTKLLTAEELSRLLRIPKRSIYKFAADGLLPGAFRIGKHWRFRLDSIEKWISGSDEIASISTKSSKKEFK